jgi:adenylate cyclase
MSQDASVAAPCDAPLFTWLGPLSHFAELGTKGYPRLTRRRLAIVNLMALLIAAFSAVYAVVYATYGVATYMPLIVANIVLVAIAFLVPLAHRINNVAAALLLATVELAVLFFFVHELGRDSGIQINYIIVAAVAFAIAGLERMRLVIFIIAVALALHMAAWFMFPPERARIAADPSLLDNLYVSSAVTTFCIIALIVGYAFTVADTARAEADALLVNILPEPIAERLKERPGTRVADSVGEASVMFTDLVGFTPLAHRLGAARTVAILDQVVTEFDRLASAHGVEKIKTIGDGYMAVAGVSQPRPDHLPCIARMALGLPDLVERLSAAHGVELRVRVGIAVGPVMAGVIGTDKFSYDVWGETVNLASRLESHGLPGKIQVSGDVRDALGDAFVFEPRGAIEVKGIGRLETWLLEAERASGLDIPACASPATAIRFFSKSETHSEFSNFAPYPIEVDGATWPSTEHYYQAQKFADPALQEKIRAAKKPVIAKSLSAKYRDRAREDWGVVKDAVMERAVRCKFTQHAELRRLLLSTGDQNLAEAAPNDYYWGIGKEGTGENRLGLLLMRLRTELRDEKVA